MARDVQDAIDAAAHLAQRVHPPRLDAGGLAPALRSWAHAAGIQATIDVRLSPARTPESVGAVYFCCVGTLEQLSAGAHATIAVRDDDGSIRFEVAADDMHSLDARRLQALRDRVEALGGNVVIEPESEPNARLPSAPLLPSRQSHVQQQPFHQRSPCAAA